MISKIQIKIIKIAQKQLGLTDEKYREILSDRYWKHSCTELTYAEASDLIDYFKTLGFEVMPSRLTPHVSRAKKYESSIAGLREEICDIAQKRWGGHWEQSLNKLLHNRFGVHHWKFLNVDKGVRAKKALFAMQAAGPYKAVKSEKLKAKS